jgi:hypothetical protein
MSLVATCTMLWAVSPNPWNREMDKLILYITNTSYDDGVHHPMLHIFLSLRQ